MLVNLAPIIHHGILDNTVQGSIRLLLWCVGEAAPIALEMPGNCLRDIAGCRVSFHLQETESAESTLCKKLQELAHALKQAEEPVIAGDMTLSRRIPLQTRQGNLANVLSLEFFQGVKLRFLIETERFDFEIGPPAWQCTRAQESAQEVINMSAMHDHVLAHVTAFRGPSLMHLGTAEMPTCQWDFVLNRTEAYMIIAPSIRAKYAGHARGMLAEAFVLDRLQFLDEAAEAEEHGTLYWGDSGTPWEALDFMEPAHAKLARSAMRHPLFAATANLSQIIQKHIIANMDQYRENRDIDMLLTNYSCTISHVLATIMLAREGRVQVGAISSRAESLCLRMEQLMSYGKALPPKAHTEFMHGVDSLIAELKEFLCTLRK